MCREEEELVDVVHHRTFKHCSDSQNTYSKNAILVVFFVITTTIKGQEHHVDVYGVVACDLECTMTKIHIVLRLWQLPIKNTEKEFKIVPKQIPFCLSCWRDVLSRRDQTRAKHVLVKNQKRLVWRVVQVQQLTHPTKIVIIIFYYYFLFLGICFRLVLYNMYR